DLGLAQVPRTGADLALDPARPLGEIVVMERVVEAEQAFEVLDRRPRRLAAAGLGDRSSDLLRERIRRPQPGVFGLDGLELMHQLVDLGIADGRRGEVVPLPMLLDLLSQGSVALADVGRDVVDVGWQVSRLGRHKHRRYCLPPTMSFGDACSRPANKARAIPPATAEPVMAVAVARPSLPRAPTTTATNAPKLNRIAPMTAAAVPALSPCLDSASASVFGTTTAPAASMPSTGTTKPSRLPISATCSVASTSPVAAVQADATRATTGGLNRRSSNGLSCAPPIIATAETPKSRPNCCSSRPNCCCSTKLLPAT